MPSVSHKYADIVLQVDINKFNLPISQSTKDYFPEYLQSRFDNLLIYYEQDLKGKIDKISNDFDNFDQIAKSLSEGIVETVNLYFNGELQEAYSRFSNRLNNLNLTEIATLLKDFKVNGASFYRGRLGEKSRFTPSDLFHIPFELRNRVSTNRFSISGKKYQFPFTSI